MFFRMNPKNVKVGNIPAIKLTKPGDDLDGCLNSAPNFVSKNAEDLLHVVSLAGTNDLRLSRRQTQPINLIDNPIESLDEFEKFTNVESILYLCVNYLHVLIYPLQTGKCMNSTSL